MTKYKFAKVPPRGEAIEFSNGALKVPDRPIVPFVEGDGTGPDIWRASVQVFDAAVERAYEGQRAVAWMEVFAGEESFQAVPGLAAAGNGRRNEGVPRLDQGAAHDSGGRRNPIAERHAAASARPLRVHSSGPLFRRCRRTA